jgi:hypothetical protein
MPVLMIVSLTLQATTSDIRVATSNPEALII